QLEAYDAFTFPPEYLGDTALSISWSSANTDYAGLAFDPENDLLYVFGGSVTGTSADYGKAFAYIKAGAAIIESSAKFSNAFGDFDIGTGQNAGLGAYYGLLP